MIVSGLSNQELTRGLLTTTTWWDAGLCMWVIKGNLSEMWLVNVLLKVLSNLFEDAEFGCVQE